jgi:hypothetical protein
MDVWDAPAANIGLNHACRVIIAPAPAA